MTPTNTLLIGPPGIGKTAHVQSVFDHVEVLLVSTMVEEDIAGLPYREGHAEKRTEPPFYGRLRDAHKSGKTTALFLDELDKGRRSVCDTLLTLITSVRGVELLQLPPDTAIIAAANTPEWGGGDGIGDAMISRFAVIQFAPDIASWVELTKKRYQSELADKLIHDVMAQTFPLIEVAGEEWHKKRITSPRTIWMAMDALLSDGPQLADPEDMVRGLLTANAADRLISLYRSSGNTTRDAANKILRASVAAKKHSPVRV